MATLFAVRGHSAATDHVAGILAAAHTKARAGVSGFAVRDAFGREGGTGVVVHHVDFDHDGAPADITDAAIMTAIGRYGTTLAASGFHLKGMIRADGLCDGLLIT